MREPRAGMRTAEKVAAIVAIIAALVVLNGAWVNQHSWQNVSWRIALAGTLVVLAIAVETNALGRLRLRDRDAETAVPEFLRSGGEAAGISAEKELARADAVGTGERT